MAPRARPHPGPRARRLRQRRRRRGGRSRWARRSRRAQRRAGPLRAGARRPASTSCAPRATATSRRTASRCACRRSVDLERNITLARRRGDAAAGRAGAPPALAPRSTSPGVVGPDTASDSDPAHDEPRGGCAICTRTVLRDVGRTTASRRRRRSISRARTVGSSTGADGLSALDVVLREHGFHRPGEFPDERIDCRARRLDARRISRAASRRPSVSAPVGDVGDWNVRGAINAAGCLVVGAARRVRIATRTAGARVHARRGPTARRSIDAMRAGAPTRLDHRGVGGIYGSDRLARRPRSISTTGCGSIATTTWRQSEPAEPAVGARCRLRQGRRRGAARRAR